MPSHPDSPSSPVSVGNIDEDGYENTGIISQALVTWLTPLLSIGFKRPLEATDLPPLRPALRSDYLRERLTQAWIRRKESSSVYNLLLALLDAFGRLFWLAGLLKLIGDICALSSPLVLSLIIADLKQTDRSLTYGILLCLLIFALQMTNTLTVNNYFNITMQIGLKVRTSMSALIYGKALRLSSLSRQSFSTGQIVNLMSTDASRLDAVVTFVHYIWSGPFQVLVIITLLFRLLSWAAFVGVGVLIIFIPIQSQITATLSKFRKV